MRSWIACAAEGRTRGVSRRVEGGRGGAFVDFMAGGGVGEGSSEEGLEGVSGGLKVEEGGDLRAGGEAAGSS